MEEPHEAAPPPGQMYRMAWGFYLALAVGGVVWIGARTGEIPSTSRNGSPSGHRIGFRS